jgi:hypothetical protein
VDIERISSRVFHRLSGGRRGTEIFRHLSAGFFADFSGGRQPVVSLIT